MQTVILCGGKATRLYPLTEKIPKSMIRIKGKTFLEYQLDLLKKNGLNDIVLCIGDKGEQIREYFADGKRFGVKISYSSDGKKLLGTGGALKKAEKILDNVFLAMYGDSYLPFDFQKAISFFRKNSGLGMMTVFRNKDKYVKSNTKIEGNLVKYYSKKRKIKNTDCIDYGVSVFRKAALKLIPQNQPSDLSDLHKALIKRKQLLAYPAKQRFYEIGSLSGLEEFKRYLKRKNLSKK